MRMMQKNMVLEKQPAGFGLLTKSIRFFKMVENRSALAVLKQLWLLFNIAKYSIKPRIFFKYTAMYCNSHDRWKDGCNYGTEIITRIVES